MELTETNVIQIKVRRSGTGIEIATTSRTLILMECIVKTIFKSLKFYVITIIKITISTMCQKFRNRRNATLIKTVEMS